MSISENLLNVIEDILNRKIKKYENMDFKATIVGKTKDGKYNVKSSNNTYLVSNASGRDYEVGNIVWVHKPNGSDTGQFIIASEYGQVSSGSNSGTSGAVSSVDGRVGNVVLTDKYASKENEHTHSNKSILDTITSVFINKWDTAYSHATSAHARTDATLTESSAANGNIKINGIETKVYELPDTVASQSDVSTAKQEAIQAAYQNANGYTDARIANLINGAPETLDTLKEVADAINDNKSVVEALDTAIGTKAKQSELDTHVNNNTIHIVTSEREKWNGISDKMGSTDISNVGSTVTEAISNLNTKDTELSNKINVLNDNIGTIDTSLCELNNNLFNKIYPIGTIYMSSSNANPCTLFGGTWIAWGQGRVPVGAGSNGITSYSVESTGGSESVSHSHSSTTSGSTAITVSQMPSHTHNLITEFGANANSEFSPAADKYMQASGTKSVTRFPKSGLIQSTGEGQGHTHSIPASNSVSIDVRQPYIVCYMWKRIA